MPLLPVPPSDENEAAEQPAEITRGELALILARLERLEEALTRIHERETCFPLCAEIQTELAGNSIWTSGPAPQMIEARFQRILHDLPPA